VAVAKDGGGSAGSLGEAGEVRSILGEPVPRWSARSWACAGEAPDPTTTHRMAYCVAVHKEDDVVLSSSSASSSYAISMARRRLLSAQWDPEPAELEADPRPAALDVGRSEVRRCPPPQASSILESTGDEGVALVDGLQQNINGSITDHAP
jgi:hypothetical protein